MALFAAERQGHAPAWFTAAIDGLREDISTKIDDLAVKVSHISRVAAVLHNETRGFGVGERFKIVPFSDGTDPTGEDHHLPALTSRAAVNGLTNETVAEYYAGYYPDGELIQTARRRTKIMEAIVTRTDDNSMQSGLSRKWAGSGEKSHLVQILLNGSLPSPPPSSPKTLEDLVAALVRSLTDILSRARYTLKDPCYISTIPPDVLRIFFFLRDEEYVLYGRRRRRDALITASHVCRLWRELVLHYGALWGANINWTTYPAVWLKKRLELAGRAQIDFVAVVTPHTLGRLLANMELLRRFAPMRIRTIELSFEDYNCATPALESIAKRLRGPFPRLQVLSLKNVSSSDDWDLLDRNPSCLHVLTLVDVNPNFHNLSIFRDLRELSVIDANVNPLTLAQWLNLLCVMPHLTDLTIKGTIKPDTFATHDPAPVLLTNLATLSLAGLVGSPDGIDTLLSYIETPRGCNLYFAGVFEDASESFHDEGLVAWFRRRPDESYRSGSLHACPDPNRIIMHNQVGPAACGSVFR
ncbi:hypothetical protein NLJ89_g4896 [Agrocybe chaxingu]|uniref:Mug135-like C-terminal domain-containing protein n=1 Tax=Agrocybe chaxingu TaxID=84603 RepID=A0A9W8K184_9AGAR|nr:hypothetical protein NLJ89_g4896 [Agrocybe chaxingu]